MNNNTKQLPKYISSLLHADVYDHAIEHIQLLETHISWVILTGHYAYKIKKPVNFGFLDFSTLEKRHFYCNEELRLNSRLASAIYLEVIPITGSKEHPTFAGSGEIIDYAIKMVEFPQDMQLDRMLDASMLQQKHIETLAAMVAEFHQQTAVANKDINYGSPEQIYRPIKENFIQLQKLLNDDTASAQLNALETWSQATFKRLKPIFAQRKDDGFIRECHGDLHLRNLVFINEKPVAFDCIEFDPGLRWIDSISDLAFLVMDLQSRQQAGFAQRLLNTYLEKTGDYAATQVLGFYLMYRAIVRAKVEAIRASQMTNDPKEQDKAKKACSGYLNLAQSYLQENKPALIITCGMSASGKSTQTQPLIEKLAAIRIRSDVERKRLFKLADKTNSSEAFIKGIYTCAATQKTYQHLSELAEQLLNSGYSVIIDATCLKYEQRQLFRQFAARNAVPFIIVQFTAQPSTLRQRINNREKEISDADQSILEQQLLNWQALRKNELPEVISIDTESSIEVDSLINKIVKLISLQSR